MLEFCHWLRDVNEMYKKIQKTRFYLLHELVLVSWIYLYPCSSDVRYQLSSVRLWISLSSKTTKLKCSFFDAGHVSKLPCGGSIHGEKCCQNRLAWLLLRNLIGNEY